MQKIMVNKGNKSQLLLGPAARSAKGTELAAQGITQSKP
jgi:hypothetical protein